MKLNSLPIFDNTCQNPSSVRQNTSTFCWANSGKKFMLLNHDSIHSAKKADFPLSTITQLTWSLNILSLPTSVTAGNIPVPSCAIKDLWLLNKQCIHRKCVTIKMSHSVWLTCLCFCSLWSSFRDSTLACLLSLLMSRPKPTACSALLPPSTCSSSTGKTDHYTVCFERIDSLLGGFSNTAFSKPSTVRL